MDEMEAHGYSIEWVEADGDQRHAIICESRSDDIIEENDEMDEDEYLVGEEIIPSTEIITISNSLDQIAAENLIYMAQDGSVEVMGDLIEEQVEQADNADYNEHQYFECQVTEEVITDDWVQQQGVDRVEISVDQLTSDSQNDEIPLPTDVFMSSRPYPCDFCSRRFRKEINLLTHMVAHKNDRPHTCKLCGARYIHKVDLLDHLKGHAQMPDNDMDIRYMDQLLAPGRGSHLDEDDEDLMESIPVRKTTRNQRKTPAAKKPANRKQSRAKKDQDTIDDKYTDDIKYLMEAARQHEGYELEEPTTFPVTDASRPFMCQKCGVGFAREKALIAHTRLHGTENGLECESCSDVFWDVSLLREHQRIHHAGNSSLSECDPDKDDGGDSETESFYCSVCGMSFHRLELLKRHGRTHIRTDSYTESNQYEDVKHCCNVCGENFAEALDLLAHAEQHARNALFKCTLCGEAFVDEKSIKKHISNFHSNELTQNSCRICGKQCRDERSLSKHAWDHSKEKKHACVNCGKNFHNKARLRRHMLSHRNKSVTCNICGDVFADGRSLMNHRHSHTNISGRQFPCRECGKTFGSRSSQQIHMRIHTGERPYGCRFCWKAFADGGTLRKHERIHTGEKPYACPVCPRAFNQRVVLREHIRSHHSNVDPTYTNTSTPHHCVVCGDRFKTPQEIIQHLIGHSDTNTASRRQPPTGPRKYKRRRKLKPDELERWRTNMPSIDASAEADNSFTSQKSNERQQDDPEDLYENESYIKPAKNERRGRITKDDLLEDMFDDLDDTLNNIASTVPTPIEAPSTKSFKSPTKKRGGKVAPTPTESTSSAASRPKMIHTQKTRVQIDDGKRKSRTLITRSAQQAEPLPPPPPAPATPTSKRSRRSTARQAAKMNNTETTVSPVKQNRSSVKVEHINNDFSEANLLRELSKKSIHYSPDVVSDLEEILRSPIKSKESNEERLAEDSALHVKTPPGRNTRLSKRLSNRNSPGNTDVPRPTPVRSSARKAKVSTTDDELLNSIAMNIKQEKEESYTMTSDEFFTCEMCSAVFRDRAQLLVHVPIHI